MKRDLAKKGATKAEREERKAAKLKEAVDKELSKRQVQEVLAKREKEVKTA
jgi:hypothetical protein